MLLQELRQIRHGSTLLGDQLGPLKGQNDEGNGHQLEDDAGDGVGEGAGDKGGEGEFRAAGGEQGELDHAPDRPADEHGGNKRGVDRGV